MTKNNEILLGNKKPIELVQEIEEKVIEKQEKIKETITSIINPERMWAGTSYIGSPDSNIWTELDQNIASDHNKHRGTSPFNNFCLGCLFTQGGNYGGKPDLNFSQTFHFSSGGRLVLETSESGTQEIHIPPQGGTVKIEVWENMVTLSLENEKIEQVSDEMSLLPYLPYEEVKKSKEKKLLTKYHE